MESVRKRRPLRRPCVSDRERGEEAVRDDVRLDEEERVEAQEEAPRSAELPFADHRRGDGLPARVPFEALLVVVTVPRAGERIGRPDRPRDVRLTRTRPRDEEVLADLPVVAEREAREIDAGLRFADARAE